MLNQSMMVAQLSPGISEQFAQHRMYSCTEKYFSDEKITLVTRIEHYSSRATTHMNEPS